jgi:hypothetical protein
MFTYLYCEGVGSWRTITAATSPGGTLPDVTPNDQERRGGRKRCLLLARAGLSSYICGLCTMGVNLSVLGVVVLESLPYYRF